MKLLVTSREHRRELEKEHDNISRFIELLESWVEPDETELIDEKSK